MNVTVHGKTYTNNFPLTGWNKQCCGLSDRLGLYCSPEKDCCWCWLTFQQPERKPSSEWANGLPCRLNGLVNFANGLPLMMASTQVVETSVNTNNSPSQDYTTNPDDHSNHNIHSPGFKPFTVIWNKQLSNRFKRVPRSFKRLHWTFERVTDFCEWVA